MELESYLDQSEPDMIRVRGHRIDLAIIVKAFQNGQSPEQIVHDYATLTLEEVYGVIAYYLRNQAEVDRYVREGDAAADHDYQEYLRGPQNPATLRIRKLIAERQQDQRG